MTRNRRPDLDAHTRPNRLTGRLPVILALALNLAVPAVLGAAAPAASALLPDVPGWKKDGPPEIYQPANLYEYIDGAAELYLSYGFEELAVQNYQDKQKTALTVEVYRHRDAAHAFGIYSQEKPPQGPFQAVGAQGYGDALSFNFIGGPYYVKINFLGKAADSAAQLKAFAIRVAARIPPPIALPAVLKCFPATGKVADSEKFAARNFLGQSFLHSGFTADYTAGSQTRQLFLLEGTDPADARAMVDKWAALAKTKAPASGTVAFKDPYNGPVQLRIAGRYVWGCLGNWGQASENALDQMEKGLRGGKFIK
jgi:hypothetical protein